METTFARQDQYEKDILVAMDCGHFEPDKEKQIERYESGFCPVCPQENLARHREVVSHKFCSCCLECWVLTEEKQLRSVFHS